MRANLPVLQITFLDCQGVQEQLLLSYNTSGWVYYLSDTIFKLSLWFIATIFTQTSIRLATILENEKVLKESRELLESAQLTYEEI